MADITTDNARYVAFLSKFPAGVLTADQIAHLASILSKELQIQTSAKEISDVLTKIMASAYTDTDFLTYEFSDVSEVSVVISTVAHTIAIHVPNGTVVTALVANFTMSAGAICSVGGVAQVSGTTANNFTNPVTYLVTAQDKITTQEWVVTVTVDPA